MITSLKRILVNSALIMALGLSFSCAGDQQQGQDDQLESQENYEDEGNEAGGENTANENEESNNDEGNNNYGDNEETNNYGAEEGEEELNNANLGENDEELSNDANVTEDNLNEGYNEESNAYGGNEALVNDTANEGEIDQVINEMNEGEASELTENEVPLNDEMLAEEEPLNAEAPIEETVAEEMVEETTTEGVEAVVGTQAAPGLPELGSKMSYIVQKGDSLVKIATRVYGNPTKWTEIASFTGLANPKLIYPGDVVYYQLTDQTLAFASAYETLPRSEIQIMDGDTLSSIAGRVLGNPENWKTIWRHNDNISNPDKLTAGTTIYYVDPGMLADAVQDFKVKFAKVKVKSQGSFKVAAKTVKTSKKSNSRLRV
jgi:hypothetical protein